MNRTELIKAVAEQANAKRDAMVVGHFTLKEVREILDALQEVTFATVKDEDVKLMDGVTLTSVYKEAKVAKNPRTGEPIDVPAKYVPKVKFGKHIKEAINQ